MNYACPSFNESTETIEVLSRANAEYHRRLAEVSRRVFRIMCQLDIGCDNRCEVVMEASADTDRSFVNLMEVNAGKLNAGLVALGTKCGSERGGRQKKQEN